MNSDLFTGKLVRLAAFNPEVDAEITARWSRDTEYHRLGDNDPAYRGHGYGTDAMRVTLRYGFMELNLQRIQLNVYSYNERAIKSYLKAGFVVEGRQRGMLRRDGERWDFVYMSVLRDEWLAMNN